MMESGNIANTDCWLFGMIDNLLGRLEVMPESDKTDLLPDMTLKGGCYRYSWMLLWFGCVLESRWSLAWAEEGVARDVDYDPFACEYIDLNNEYEADLF